MHLIAMIPARMGSKRIPFKNIRLMAGKPLIQYAIDAAKTVALGGVLDAIWVNSESPQLGELAHRCGVEFHQRPPELAVDTATNQDFTTEFLQRHDCDYVVMINPTSPLLQPQTIVRFCSLVQQGAYDTVLSVLEERAEYLFQGQPVNFELQRKINSQDLAPLQKVVWALTAWKRDSFLKLADAGRCSVFGGRIQLFPMPLREAWDIDTPDQWDLVEQILFSEKSRIQPLEHSKTGTGE